MKMVDIFTFQPILEINCKAAEHRITIFGWKHLIYRDDYMLEHERIFFR